MSTKFPKTRSNCVCVSTRSLRLERYRLDFQLLIHRVNGYSTVLPHTNTQKILLVCSFQQPPVHYIIVYDGPKRVSAPFVSLHLFPYERVYMFVRLCVCVCVSRAHICFFFHFGFSFLPNIIENHTYRR